MPNGGRDTATCGGAALLAGLLLVPGMAACSSPEQAAPSSDIGSAPRSRVKDGGTLRWAIDAVPSTLNVFQADATQDSARVTGAVLPALFTLDARGRPQRNADFLRSAEVTRHSPRQVVVYKLNPKAVWTSGKPIGVADFKAQWRALSGEDSAYWPARNDGYRQIESVRRGEGDDEVKVTFRKPYADWKSLFSPLYPKSATGTPKAFNDESRTRLAVTAGPFKIEKIDPKGEHAVTLARNEKWWGDRPKLDKLVLRAVPRGQRAAALARGVLDLAELEPTEAGAAAPPSTASSSPSDRRSAPSASARPSSDPAAGAAAGTNTIIRRAAEPAFTQLTLNGHTGPLADEQVRKGVARAIDRAAIAKAVLEPAGLPPQPLGNHLVMTSQDGYQDNSAALGGPDPKSAEALLDTAGWKPGSGPAKPLRPPSSLAGPLGGGGSVAASAEGAAKALAAAAEEGRRASQRAEPARQDDKQPAEQKAEPRKEPEKPKERDKKDADKKDADKKDADKKDAEKKEGKKEGKQAEEHTGPDGAAAGGHPAAGPGAPQAEPNASGDDNAGVGRNVTVVEPVTARVKDGKRLSLRLLVPEHAATLRSVADRVAAMLSGIGVRTEITRVGDDSFFRDHVAAGDFDLALFSWPATAFAATEARPIYAKPLPAPDGSLIVEQNYARVGTDEIDTLFARAGSELDGKAAGKLEERADARIWAEAHSLPLYQRPQLVGVRVGVANAGAFGFVTPRYQDIGYLA